ncbi:MAG TPA: arginine-ornithine antiporter [Stellaceae bacterium]|nr:arginine-ornithine antiporter [Stellaceae bacterium]
MSTATVAPAAGAGAQEGSNKLSLLPLVALVVGSMIGGGVFNLPSDMSAHASPGAIIIGWAITGLGMLMLAFVYQGLALRKPDLNSGPYAYARAGFGPYIGFQSAWGYWVSAWLGNVSYAVAIFSSLAFFFPTFGKGNNLQSVIGASIALWLIHALVLKGVKQAAFVNVVTTAAKVVPLVVFAILAILAFHYDKFTLNFWGAAQAGSEGLGSIVSQAKSTMLVTLWVFIGIEGASVYSSRAAKRSDVGTATVIGFFGALSIYVLVSLLSTGILTQKELAGLEVPSMAGVLQSLVGNWGAGLISLGLIVSVGGAFLSWTMLCAEIPFAAAKDGNFPGWFARANDAGSPVNSLWITNVLVQIFLIVALFASSTYQFLYSIASVAILPPYVFSGAYALKLALQGETYERDGGARNRDIVIGGLATIYGIWLCYAADLKYLLLATILFAPATLIYMMARAERSERMFTPGELAIAALVTAAAVYAVYELVTGGMSV